MATCNCKVRIILFNSIFNLNSLKKVLFSSEVIMIELKLHMILQTDNSDDQKLVSIESHADFFCPEIYFLNF